MILQMKRSCKYRKQEKGVTLIILIVTIVIMIILAGTTINMVFGENGALQQSKKTQDMQKEHVKQEDTEVNTLLEEVNNAELGSGNPPTATITVNSTATLTGQNITATVVQENGKNELDLNKCKYVYNTVDKPLGLEETAYTGGTLANKTNTLTLNFTTQGTYYLHTLTVDTKGNAQETISGAISVISNDATQYATANTTSNPYYTFTAPADGVYQLQVWGAQGGRK